MAPPASLKCTRSKHSAGRADSSSAPSSSSGACLTLGSANALAMSAPKLAGVQARAGLPAACIVPSRARMHSSNGRTSQSWSLATRRTAAASSSSAACGDLRMRRSAQASSSTSPNAGGVAMATRAPLVARMEATKSRRQRSKSSGEGQQDVLQSSGSLGGPPWPGCSCALVDLKRSVQTSGAHMDMTSLVPMRMQRYSHWKSSARGSGSGPKPVEKLPGEGIMSAIRPPHPAFSTSTSRAFRCATAAQKGAERHTGEAWVMLSP
mmetsp:Transcript_62047/g.192315  ORF Transcript_62047/g.192315 Transcript_62047/m.192315 type:complete len:265 (-) Transcript_62047:349-1143(-)